MTLLFNEIFFFAHPENVKAEKNIVYNSSFIAVLNMIVVLCIFFTKSWIFSKPFKSFEKHANLEIVLNNFFPANRPRKIHMVDWWHFGG